MNRQGTLMNLEFSTIQVKVLGSKMLNVTKSCFTIIRLDIN